MRKEREEECSREAREGGRRRFRVNNGKRKEAGRDMNLAGMERYEEGTPKGRRKEGNSFT